MPALLLQMRPSMAAVLQAASALICKGHFRASFRSTWMSPCASTVRRASFRSSTEQRPNYQLGLTSDFAPQVGGKLGFMRIAVSDGDQIGARHPTRVRLRPTDGRCGWARLGACTAGYGHGRSQSSCGGIRRAPAYHLDQSRHRGAVRNWRNHGLLQRCRARPGVVFRCPRRSAQRGCRRSR